MQPLAGKVALVTGAARGQGRSHALRLAADGADIIAIDHCAPVGSVPCPLASPDDLGEVATQVRALGRRVVARQADVRDQAGLRLAVDESVTALGRLDIVSAGAGVLSGAPDQELTEQAWQDVIDINLTGAWLTCKVAVPHIIASGRGGLVVLTSSVAGYKPCARAAHQAAAEHALIGLGQALAQELAPEGIRVNVITPALAEPRDVSEALAFLASDAARHITGISLPVDAGALAT
jgi:(+)-trans-carveol dehydrogenase